MLMLIFYVGEDLYALDCMQVVEVIPRVLFRKVHHAPHYVAGLFNYRGMIVPAIDLCHLIQGQPSRSHLSTRIVIVNYTGKDNVKRYLGLMAERITETLDRPNAGLDHHSSNNDTDNTHPFLGEMLMDEKGMIQSIRLENLLSDSQYQYLLAGNTK